MASSYHCCRSVAFTRTAGSERYGHITTRRQSCTTGNYYFSRNKATVLSVTSDITDNCSSSSSSGCNSGMPTYARCDPIFNLLIDFYEASRCNVCCHPQQNDWIPGARKFSTRAWNLWQDRLHQLKIFCNKMGGVLLMSLPLCLHGCDVIYVHENCLSFGISLLMENMALEMSINVFLLLRSLPCGRD